MEEIPIVISEKVIKIRNNSKSRYIKIPDNQLTEKIMIGNTADVSVVDTGNKIKLIYTFKFN